MKLYATAPDASMDMKADPVLSQHLRALIAEDRIDVAIETGTYLGLGSTRFVAEAFNAVAPPRRFVTVEVNFTHWCLARANLRPYPFVDCRWGRTVALARARAHMQEDALLRDPKNQEADVYIDSLDNPLGFYEREVAGDAPDLRPPAPPQMQGGKQVVDIRTLLFEGEDLLPRLLTAHAEHAPLIILDSAGGMGFLEFQIVREMMAGRRFALLLDDVHHVKHFRSLQHMRSDPAFQIVAAGTSWALARHP